MNCVGKERDNEMAERRLVGRRSCGAALFPIDLAPARREPRPTTQACSTTANFLIVLLTALIILCAGYSAFAQSGGVGYADSPIFTLNTTGIPTTGGGVGYADSATFTLNTTGISTTGGGVGYADSADFTLNTQIQGYLWTNTASGNWNAASNWSPNGVPGSNDNAYIINPGNYIVFITANAAVSNLLMDGASGTQSIAMSDYNFVLTGTGIVGANGAISNSGGNLAGPGSLTDGGTMTWTGGSITNLNFTNAGTLTISNGGFGILQLYGPGLVNTGTINWAANTIRLLNGAVLSNAPGGIFNAKNAGGQIVQQGSSPVFANAGQINVSPGINQSVTVQSGITFNNSGVINVQSGTFNLQCGGTITGSSSLNILGNSAVLDFSQGTYALQSGCAFGGQGNFTVAGATVNEFSPLNFNGIVNVSSGNLNLMPGATAALTLLNVSGGTLYTLAPVTVAGNMNFTGGNIYGAGGVTANGTLAISGVVATLGYNFTNGILVNNGTATASSTFGVDYGSLISNSASGTLTFSPSTNMTVVTGGSGTDFFANLGQIIVSAPSAVSVIMSPVFNNSGAGTVAVNGGTLSLNGGGTDTSASAVGFDVASGATLNLASTTYTFNPGTTVTGPGNLTVASGRANFNGAVTVGGAVTIGGSATANCSASSPFTWNTLVLNGTLTGSSPVSLTGAMTFTGGSIYGTGGVMANGTLAMSGSPTLGGGSPTTNGTLVNNGSATLSSLLSIVYGSLLSNSPNGTLTFTGGLTVVSGGGGGSTNILANAGTIIDNATGSATVTIEPFMINSGAGAVNVNGGTLLFNGGGADTSTSATGINVAAGATFCVNGGTFNFNPGSFITGPGDLKISNGTANLNGAITLGGNYPISGSTANFAGSYDITTTVSINGGTAIFTGTGNTVAPTNLTMTGGGLLGGNRPGDSERTDDIHGGKYLRNRRSDGQRNPEHFRQ